MSPRPWFRPAIREFKANPEAFVLQHTDFTTLDEIQDADTLVRAVSFALENRMVDNVSAQSEANRSPGTRPDSPKRVTGNLANSVSAVRIR